MTTLFATAEVVRVGKFGLVGILNTLIDFSIYNLLTHPRFGLPKVRANLVSTTVAMIFSFFANRNYVFQPGTQSPLVQVLLFFLVTAFGLYVLQSIIIYFLADRWRWPRRVASYLLKQTGLRRLFGVDFVVKNGAKVLATLVSLTWNYIMYGKVVFR